MKLEIEFDDAAADPEALERLTQSLYETLDQLEEVDQVERPREIPPAGTKSAADLGRALVGVLMTEIPLPNVAPVAKLLFNRLAGKSVKLKAEIEGKSIELEASGTSQTEILELLAELKEFAS